LRVTVPFELPNVVPAITNSMFTGPAMSERLVIPGITVKVGSGELDTPATVTTTWPVVAFRGTGTTILVELQLVGDAVTFLELKVTALPVAVGPKPVPVIVTDVPTGPVLVDRELIVGTTLKIAGLVATPPDVVTTTLPVVALGGTGTMMVKPFGFQVVGTAGVPLNVTVLLPCDEPKFVPVIVTDLPTAAEPGDTLVIVGVAAKAEAAPSAKNSDTPATIPNF
jgi:hypothetical protein